MVFGIVQRFLNCDPWNPDASLQENFKLILIPLVELK